MATFVLVGGGWSGAWTWRLVTPYLKAAGHDVLPLTLTGLGEKSHLLSPAVDLNTHIADIVNTLRWNELHDVVLVGHSYGGAPITGAADQAPERIASLVYLDAFMPQHGHSLLDIMAPDRRLQVEDAVAKGGEGWKLPRIHAPAFVVHGMPECEAEVKRLATPHPFATFKTKLQLTGAGKQIPKKTYVVARDYNPSPMHGFAERCRAEGGWTVTEIDCHHMLQYFRPRRTAELLMAAA